MVKRMFTHWVCRITVDPSLLCDQQPGAVTEGKCAVSEVLRYWTAVSVANRNRRDIQGIWEVTKSVRVGSQVRIPVGAVRPVSANAATTEEKQEEVRIWWQSEHRFEDKSTKKAFGLISMKKENLYCIVLIDYVKDKVKYKTRLTGAWTMYRLRLNEAKSVFNRRRRWRL